MICGSRLCYCHAHVVGRVHRDRLTRVTAMGEVAGCDGVKVIVGLVTSGRTAIFKFPGGIVQHGSVGVSWKRSNEGPDLMVMGNRPCLGPVNGEYFFCRRRKGECPAEGKAHLRKYPCFQQRKHRWRPTIFKLLTGLPYSWPDVGDG